MEQCFLDARSEEQRGPPVSVRILEKEGSSQPSFLRAERAR